ncbi:hypothetical protein CBL_05444 [Carabus blaptoides fortunei]
MDDVVDDDSGVLFVGRATRGLIRNVVTRRNDVSIADDERQESRAERRPWWARSLAGYVLDARWLLTGRSQSVLTSRAWKAVHARALHAACSRCSGNRRSFGGRRAAQPQQHPHIHINSLCDRCQCVSSFSVYVLPHQ